MSLYQLERDGDADELARLLTESSNAAVRRRAAEALRDLTPEDSTVSALAEAAATDDDRAVRSTALDALDQFGPDALGRFVATVADVDIADAKADWAAARQYASLLDASRAEVRIAAVAVLGHLGMQDAAGPLSALVDDPDPRVRARVCRSLGQVGHPQAATALTTMVTDEAPPVRHAAVEALGDIGGSGARSALVTALDDPVERVRRAAVDALGTVGGLAVVDSLASALDDDRSTVRRAAVYAVVQLLSDAPAAQSHRVRESVVTELTDAPDEQVLDPLVELLAESSQPPQLRNATWLLGQLADGANDRAVEALVDALRDPETAQFAATSLVTVGGDDLEVRLLALVEDADEPAEARAKAAYVLGHVGDDLARTSLDGLVDSVEEETVRRQAFTALSKLGGR